MKNKENNNFIVSRDVSQKFEFYFLALVFTILGFSIQTSSFTRDYFQYIIETIALLSLLTSGLAGLFRIEWMSVAYRHYGMIQEDQKKLDMLNQGVNGKPILDPSCGKQFTKEELLKEKKELAGFVLKQKMQSERVDKWNLIKYKIHKIAFIVGIICLTISRIMLNINELIPITSQST